MTADAGRTRAQVEELIDAVGLAEVPERVSQNCELCYLARRHLRQFHPDIFGPAEVYD